MGGRYRYDGPISHAKPTRTFHRWLIFFEDGDHLCLRKRDANRYAKVLLRHGCDIRVYEETITRRIDNSTRRIEDDSFKIEITDRIKNEILIEDTNKLKQHKP